MFRRTLLLSLVLALSVLVSSAKASWRDELKTQMPRLGHRNWIVIADSAYPLQTAAGIQTIATNSTQTEVVAAVLKNLSSAKHVRPIIFTDAELPLVPERDAKGIEDYRERLERLLNGRTKQSLPHEQIITKLDQAGKTFHVLLLKTTMTIPYTSVFIQLDCAYWSPEAEQRLRTAMKAGVKK